MKPEDLLFHLKQACKNRPDGIPMYPFKNIICRKYKISNKYWSWMMRYLVNNRKIEIHGFDQKLKPVLNDIETNLNSEVRITTDLIKDIVSRMKKCRPSEAYKFCLEYYGFCNAESFTRLMRRMVEWGELQRDDQGYYSLPHSVGCHVIKVDE